MAADLTKVAEALKNLGQAESALQEIKRVAEPLKNDLPKVASELAKLPTIAAEMTKLASAAASMSKLASDISRFSASLETLSNFLGKLK